MSTTITQRARCCANLVMISSATTPAAIAVRRSASTAGVALTATSPSAKTDASMACARVQVCANAATATKGSSATSVKNIQDARMASAQNHGSASAGRTGVAYSVTKVSRNTNFINKFLTDPDSCQLSHTSLIF